MAKRKQMMMTQMGYCMALLIVFAYMLSDEYVVEARFINYKGFKLRRHKGTIKTIKSEDGEVIDCVDIYKQPAFDHPLLKNHKIEMKSGSYPSGVESTNSEAKFIQSWQKSGQCPEGTIPILRSRHKLRHHHHRKTPISALYETQINLNTSKRVDPRIGHEYATVNQKGGTYYGLSAKINVWNPNTEIVNELSIGQIWIISGTVGNMNTIEAGWMVYPFKYNDTSTKLFIYWTSDDYQNTGCYNLDCSGFVQTSNKILLGGTLAPISEYGAANFEIFVTVSQNMATKDWYLSVNNEVLGHWPATLFTTLPTGASALGWGGEIFNTKVNGRHTSTQMGSGHFPFEGYGKASYFNNIQVLDKDGVLSDPEKPFVIISNPACYDLHVEANTAAFGTHFFFGGPGYSDKCQ